MKLEGSLDAFSLPDIFQLLSYTKKTGALRLQHAERQGVVHVVDGALASASADCGRQALARRLIGLGLVDDVAVAAAVEQATDRSAGASIPGGVVAALVSSGAVRRDEVHALAEEQLHDAVFELMRWSTGAFALAVDEVDPDDVGVRLAADEVVARVGTERARWEAAAAVVPSPDAVPCLARALAQDVTLEPSEWSLLRLVDGRRRVSDLVDLAGAGQLLTVVTLAALAERGVVEIRPAGAGDAADETARRIALLASVEPGTHVGAASEAASRRTVQAPATDEPALRGGRAPVAAPREVTAAVVEALSASEGHPARGVVPVRDEPFLSARQPEFAEPMTTGLRGGSTATATRGSAAVATAAMPEGFIERDPSVNRGLLLRLIAGVRGL